MIFRSSRLIVCLVLVLFGFFPQPAIADEIRPAYLQLTEIEADTYNVYWKVPARGENRLSLKVAFDGDVTNLQAPMAGFIGSTHIQQWTTRFINGLSNTTISIDGLARSSTDVLLRIEYLDGTSLTHRLTPSDESYTVTEKPSLGNVALTYMVLGVEHILIGIDHLLFVLVLLLLIENRRKLILTITAFTVAHSITLTLASLDLIFVPVAPVEAIIALSIVFVASEIIRKEQGQSSLTYKKPWLVSFSFGLLHGLGFAAALGEIGLPQNAVILALLQFNIGVEIGQLLFVFAYLLLIRLLKKLPLQSSTTWKKVPPYAIGSLASFWVIERTLAFF